MAKGLKRGDHIWVRRKLGTYAHHGVYVGGNQVIHYAGEPGQEGKTNAPIRRTTLEEFAKGGVVMVSEYRLSLEPDEVVAHAEGKIGQQEYDLSFNNCEHFATWCKTGRAESHQIDGVGHVVGGLAGGAVGATGAVVAVSALGTVSGLSAAGITSGLAAIGAVAGGGMVVGIAAVAFAPIAAAGVGYFVGRRVVNWWRSEQGEAVEVPLLPPPTDCEMPGRLPIGPLEDGPVSL